MRIFLVLILMIGCINAKSLFNNHHQADNSKYIEALKELIVATQKTRGVTNSYLNGNVSALLLIHSYKDEINKAIGTMESLPLASDSIVSQRSTEISHALIELNYKALKRKPAEVFENYTELIEKMLLLAQTISKHGSKELNPLGKDASKIMMEDILPLAEYLGQLRGLGSGIIAKGSIDENEKIKIMALIASADKLTYKFQTDMKKIASKYKESYPSDMHSKLGKINSSVQKYTDMAKIQVLKVKKDSTNPDKYFSSGTDVIALLMDVFDVNNKAILKDSEGWL